MELWGIKAAVFVDLRSDFHLNGPNLLETERVLRLRAGMRRLSVDIEKLSAEIGAVDLRPAGRRLATHETHRLRLHAPLLSADQGRCSDFIFTFTVSAFFLSSSSLLRSLNFVQWGHLHHGGDVRHCPFRTFPL